MCAHGTEGCTSPIITKEIIGFRKKIPVLFKKYEAEIRYKLRDVLETQPG